MSQTLRLDDGTLISAMRRKFIWRGGPDKDWIDLYSSTDHGKTWGEKQILMDGFLVRRHGIQ